MAEQRLWWIKLSDRFMTSETVDFLMSQKDGANYVVLYQMLCLKCINTDGELSRKIGEIIIEFDVNKIQRDCKWFSIDTIRIALTLYQQLGLIYRQENGILRIADFDRLVGSEMPNAERMRQLRARRAEQLASHCDGDSDKNVTVDKEKDSLLKSLKEKIYNAGAYTGVHDAIIDEVLAALVKATNYETIHFNGETYTGEAFRRVAEHLTVEQLAKIVNSIIGRADIENREKYIQSIIAKCYAIAEE